MMVTFVSECEKKALNRTRRVLDAFANRIGSRTWQTVITQEGLQAVKKLLRKTATKNTAVSCHWIRSRSRSEFLWVVGNKNKFNFEGVVPVNITKQTINIGNEKDWPYMQTLRSLIAIAALLHDWGKATILFQKKLKSKTLRLKGDPLRHEWISCILFSALVSGKTDEEWLTQLSNQEINENEILEKTLENKRQKNPFEELSPFASMVMWLILTHHRLPALRKNKVKSNYRNTEISLKANDWCGESVTSLEELFECVLQEWGYENYSEKERKEFEKRLQECFQFSKSSPLMLNSKSWTKQLGKWAQKTLDRHCLKQLESSIEPGYWRIILNHARLSLMLGDHYYSSQPADGKWSNQSSVKLIANTYNKDVFDKKTQKQIGQKGKPKQKLDEHLYYVTEHAQKAPRIMKLAETSLVRSDNTDTLSKKSNDKNFIWQDSAVKKIKQWRKTAQIESPDHFAFFAVNIASTGKGKTFANAKIMRELSPDAQSLRYILALGLRSLTLQTGKEYRTRVFNNKKDAKVADKQDFAVLIGSQAILDLYNDAQNTKVEEDSFEVVGSESQEELFSGEIDSYVDESLFSEEIKAVIKKNKHLQLLYAPVLVCTIDHIMAATETKRGGRYILPYLRLMSSDLVIDEIDDFSEKDLIPIGRLIHLAGMLGRKVMISSATIPPDLAEGYFHLYQQGWRLFSLSRNLPTSVTCAWIDEFSTEIKTIKETDLLAIAGYQKEHQSFIKNRVDELNKIPAKRKAEIISIKKAEDNEESIRNNYFQVILDALINKHKDYHEIDPVTKKSVSIGIVRMANIKPCAQLTQFLMETDIVEKDTEIRVMAYHSQQILLMRHAQEACLDKVLYRKKETPDSPDPIFQDAVIREHIKQTNAKNLIFILVATPVEEVGRDHDFDWAIIEPSSFRSIIQLAGRVLRHRDKTVEKANIGLLQYNLKGLFQDEKLPAFCHPGPESKRNKLSTPDLKELISEKIINDGINATPRISKNDSLSPENNLIDLEHECIAQMLTNYEGKGLETMESWIQECWWGSALPQVINPFREAKINLLLFRVPKNEDETEFVFKEKTPRGDLTGLSIFINDNEKSGNSNPRLWIQRNYTALITDLAEKKNLSLEKAGEIYGELSLSIYDENADKYNYSPDTGLVKQ